MAPPIGTQAHVCLTVSAVSVNSTKLSTRLPFCIPTRGEGGRGGGGGGGEEGWEREREQKTNVIRQACLVSFMSKEIVLLLKLSMCVKRKEKKKVWEERKGMEREAASRKGDYGEGGCGERG